MWACGLYDVAGFYRGDLHGLAELRQGVSSALAFGLTQKRLRNVLRHAQNPAVRAIDDRPGRARRNLYLSVRSEEHTSELQSLMRISYAVFCLKKKRQTKPHDKDPVIMI